LTCQKLVHFDFNLLSKFSKPLRKGGGGHRYGGLPGRTLIRPGTGSRCGLTQRVGSEPGPQATARQAAGAEPGPQATARSPLAAARQAIGTPPEPGPQATARSAADPEGLLFRAAAVQSFGSGRNPFYRAIKITQRGRAPK